MKRTLLTLVIALSLFSCKTTVIEPQGAHAVTITESVEEDCLTSVKFTQDGKEWGLDYLTPHELDSLKNIH